MKIESFGNPRELPSFDAIEPDAILPALEIAIRDHAAVVDRIVADRPTGFADVWLPLEAAHDRVEAVWAAVTHLHAVADTPQLRAAFIAGQARLTEYMAQVGQTRALYDVLVVLVASPDFATLPDADRVAVERAVRTFMLSGVALDDAARERFKAVSVELSQLSTEFASAVLDASDAWSEHVIDENLLAGLSEGDLAMFRAAADAKGLTGWLVTLQMPSVIAILGFAEDRGLRERMYRAYGTRASDQGPNAGQFDNGPRIARMLELRHESARLLGFPDPVALSLETKMAPNAGEVLAFLRDLAARAKPSAERDYSLLKTFAAAELGITDLQPWDTSFVADRVRRALYDVDGQAVRAYFPVGRVLEGWQSLLGRLFGIRLVERGDVAVWHGDARFFDVVDADGATIAGVYLDLHARPGKQGGAWMSQARSRLSDGTVPVAQLVCNFAPDGGAMPSLLSHNDIVTLLHETGHCLHHLFTRVERPSIAGTNGFEWDAVELPSQLMEDFAWDRDLLTAMSGHYKTGERLPADLHARMLAARFFQAGMAMVRQIEAGLFDLLLHLGRMGSDPIDVIEAVRDEVAVVRPPAWHRFPHAFDHIFGGEYASGYYSYLWAEVLAADGFQAFVEAGLVDPATGDRLRDEILSRGATRPARESFRAFRRRDADPRAMLARHGLLGVEHA